MCNHLKDSALKVDQFLNVHLFCDVIFFPSLFITTYDREEDTVDRKGSCHLTDLVPLPPFLSNFCFFSKHFLAECIRGHSSGNFK